MSNKLFIQGGGQTKAYECKSTHTGSPYLKVSSGYLDLTTNTTSGIQLKIKNGNQTYRPLQIYTTTLNCSSQYTSTSGYSGSLSRTSTSGYSGVSSKNSTSGYSGSLSKVSTSGYSYAYNTTITTGYSGYSLNISTQTVTSSFNISTQLPKISSLFKTTNATATSQFSYENFKYSVRRMSAIYSSVGNYGSTSARIHNKSQLTTSLYTTTNAPAAGIYITNTTKSSNILTRVPEPKTTSYSFSNYFNNVSGYYGDGYISASIPNITIYSKNGGYVTGTYSFYGTNWVDFLDSIASKSNALYYWRSHGQISAIFYQITTSLKRFSTLSRSVYGSGSTLSSIYSIRRGALVKTALEYKTSTTTNSTMQNITTMTRSSAYATSSTAVGALSSTTALTRSSAYNTSSTTTNAGISSTTALTRSSVYATSSTVVGALSSTTALTRTSSRTSFCSTIEL